MPYLPVTMTILSPLLPLPSEIHFLRSIRSSDVMSLRHSQGFLGCGAGLEEGAECDTGGGRAKVSGSESRPS